MHKISYEFKVKYFISFFWYSFAFFKSELRNEMTYDELELDAVLLEVLENRGSFDSMDDEELYELIEQVAQYTDGDYEEAFEFMNLKISTTTAQKLANTQSNLKR